MKTLFIAAAASTLAAISPAYSAAQDYSETPAYGSIQLTQGFLPDPHVVDLTAGGSIEAQSRFSDCRGYIANAPDYSVYYEAGFSPLIFSVDSDVDTTLVINDPNLNWVCDDDGAETPFNPMVRFDNPSSGRYDVWVGTYSPGAGAAATLFVSEIDEHSRTSTQAFAAPAYAELDITLGAEFGNVSLSGGFLPDPWQRTVTAGGPININDAIGSEAVGTCRGYTTRAPTLQLDYDGASTLFIYLDSAADTTLAINGPNGQWHCSDDLLGTDAGLEFNGESGVYDIYVGLYHTGVENARLRISEIAMGHAPLGK